MKNEEEIREMIAALEYAMDFLRRDTAAGFSVAADSLRWILGEEGPENPFNMTVELYRREHSLLS